MYTHVVLGIYKMYLVELVAVVDLVGVVEGVEPSFPAT